MYSERYASKTLADNSNESLLLAKVASFSSFEVLKYSIRSDPSRLSDIHIYVLEAYRLGSIIYRMVPTESCIVRVYLLVEFDEGKMLVE